MFRTQIFSSSLEGGTCCSRSSKCRRFWAKRDRSAQLINFYFCFRSMLIGIPCTFLSYRLDPKSPQTAKLYHHYYPTATGSAGLINTISMFSQTHIVAGVFGIISSVGWAVQVLFGGWLYKSVWDFKNNNEGISFQNVSRGGVGLRRRPGSWLDGRANFV